MAVYKYLVCVSSQSNYSSISDTIEKIATRWYRPFGVASQMFWLISTERNYSCTELRDTIRGEYSASVLVISIDTKNTAAAAGDFGTEKNWNWIKTYIKIEGQENIESPIPNAAIKKKTL